MTEWVENRLDAVADVLMGSSPPGDTYNVVGDGLPFLQGSAEFGAHFPIPVKFCSAPVKIAEPGDLMLSVRAPVGHTNFAHERIAIGRGLAVIRGSASVGSDYLRLALQHATDGLLARSGTGMFSSITAKELKAFPISLPPLAEQRRIVDVMAAVDAQIEALETEVGEARRLLGMLNTGMLAALPTTRALGEFTSTRSGPSFAAADSTNTPSEGSVPAIGIPNTKADGSIDMSVVNHVVGLPETVGRIDESSLVLIRTNGNRQRIGNVYMPGEDAHGHIVSAFQFLMKVDDPDIREFTYWVLREPSMQAAMSDAASGTTGLGNLAVKWLNSARVYWSDDAREREEAVAPLRAQDLAVRALTTELTTLRTFRSTFLTALLSQQIEIPESYDSLLEAAS